jgi:hypothetical protein
MGFNSAFKGLIEGNYLISPKWVMGPEQGKSSGRIATLSLWTSVFRDGISSIPDETVILL